MEGLWDASELAASGVQPGLMPLDGTSGSYSSQGLRYLPVSDRPKLSEVSALQERDGPRVLTEQCAQGVLGLHTLWRFRLRSYPYTRSA